MDIALAKFFFPEGLLDYFNIVSHKEEEEHIHFYLEEKNVLPEEYKNEIAKSKGFTPEITVEDFPLRGKTVFLHIKRRRWTIIKDNTIIKRDWSLVAKGTRITTEFASFLKDIIR